MLRAVAATVLLLVLASLAARPATAQERLRVAVYNTELSRDGPGLLLRDIRKGDAQVGAVVEVIAGVRPDVLLLLGFDWDYKGEALAALADRLQAAGAPYPHRFAARPNSGMATGLDMDGNGRRGEARDAQGYGAFTGQGGMAVLSVLPMAKDRVRDFSDLLWRDLPGALLPEHPDGRPFPSEEAQAVQRLSSTGHWAVPVILPGGAEMVLLAFHATPPVFDGPEDRNGRRNHDEVIFWRHFLDGAFGPAPGRRFVLAGDANLDPGRGDGRSDAIRALLQDPRLVDPLPGQETVEWDFARMRVDYLLPSSDWEVLDSGVVWPEGGAALDRVEAASRHRLGWVDLALR